MIILKPREVEKDPKGGSTPRWGSKEISSSRIRRWENRERPRRDAFDRKEGGVARNPCSKIEV